MMEELQLAASDRTTLYVHCWRSEKPKAVILLSHGMTEHSLRYDRFGQFLNQHQISLYCHDQRGHGKTGQTVLGHLRKGIDWNLMINDLFSIKKKVIDTESDCPVFLMGHSMGSFLVRRTVQLRPAMFDGLILSGTGDGQGIFGKAGVKMATIGCLFAGQEAYAERLQKMMFGGFNKAVENPQTDFDWLSRDEIEVNCYINDERCGFLCTNGFYHELLQGIQLANDPQNIASMKKDLPVYIFSGDKDPVGNLGKGIQHVQGIFLDAGLENVTVRFYPGGRHEMLNEINREIVMEDLLLWLEAELVKQDEQQEARNEQIQGSFS